MFDHEVVKKVVYGNIPNELIERVVVFGSRARNEETEDSDTDICVIFKDELPREDVLRYRVAMNRAFACDYRMPTDIVMKSSDNFNRYKGVIGSLECAIAEEGVAL